VKLVADESIEGPTVAQLRTDGQEIIYVAELEPGITDIQVLAIARQSQAMLLTADKDFGELVFRLREPHFGVLLLRLMEGDLIENATLTSRVFKEHGHELIGRFSVLTRRGLRIRN
jgi:predicted nuclease of predicted toxin-antitoxin system